MKKHLMIAALATGVLFTAFGGSASAAGNNYTVHAGDSLWKISQTYHVTIDQLKNWNQLSTDTIYVNQNLLVVPPAAQTSSAAVTTTANVSYTVKSGDTLYSIAKTYSTTVSILKNLNCLTSDLISIGQQLKIPSTISVAAPVTANPVNSTVSKKQVVIDEAKKYIGVPYLWGGTTPAGFDCSGFVNYVFNKVGVSLPRTVATQWAATSQVGVPNPGDIVYFETYQTGPSHEGIYIGNNKFIHAGSAGVTISDITTTYWKTRYLGARSAL